MAQETRVTSVANGQARGTAGQSNSCKNSERIQNSPSLGIRLKEIFFPKFPDEGEEALFQRYIRNQKTSIIPAFVFTAVVYLLCRILLVSLESDLQHDLYLIIIYLFFAVLIILTLVLLQCKKDVSELITTLSVIFLWASVTSIFLFNVAQKNAVKSASGAVGWIQLEIFTTFVVVPWRLRWILGMSLMVSVAYNVVMASLWEFPDVNQDQRTRWQEQLYKQIVANCLLFLGAILLGILEFVFTDRNLRRSYQQTKKSFSIGYQIEKEYKEQERLLLSVLPRHLADEMVRDWGTDSSGQFRKIYMSRHENVSILFADIVGFTAISSSVTAAELVKILNVLFASFDDLANKYHQQRIKILGDCYYCVCGALDQRPDHAVLSIHMGMTIVDAIRDVRKSTGKDVNMRVGIHSGSVLGGVLGQSHWQFDVLGKEVTLANHMESGGLPARVHISEATKKLLNDEFELEPGFGMERDDYLMMANMETYLVRSILKPYPEGTLDAKASEDEAVGEAQVESRRTEGSNESTYSGDDHLFQSIKFRQMLTDRSRSREALRNLNFFTTWFRDRKTEARYQARLEHFGGASMGALCVVLLLATCAKLVVLPRTPVTYLCFAAAEVILVCMAIVSSIVVLEKRAPLPQWLVRCGLAIDKNRVLRMLWALAAIVILVAADISMIVQCDVSKAEKDLKNITHFNFLDSSDAVCPAPAYFIHVGYLILLGISSLVHIEHLIKLLAIILCTCLYSILHMVVYYPLFDHYDAIVFVNDGKVVPSKYRLTVQLISASLGLLVLNRKMEVISRRLFLWKEESEKQTKRAADLSHKNEALVYNILPAHVARDFIGKQRRHMDLYSHAYDKAAVMFAACPNFHDFYTESSINNEGLECLRFLNEIISDYDELLKQPSFQSITKIKTVGPTYMAASGLALTQQFDQDTSLRVRWQHLDDLVQFGLAMKVELAHINEQSFNNFILRIGINHGPIIAGVIGAQKPHYDIWGNTVNVASRMESTGMADKIQVVEETKLILEEFGYFFKKRGMVKVKGKGELMTYFLEGQRKDVSCMPNQVPIE